MKKNLMAAHAAAALACVRPALGGPLTQEVVGSAQGGPSIKPRKKIALSPGERVRENARVKRMGGFYNIDLTAVMVGAMVVGMLLGSVLSLVIPWLWGVVKPLLHALTA